MFYQFGMLNHKKGRRWSLIEGRRGTVLRQWRSLVLVSLSELQGTQWSKLAATRLISPRFSWPVGIFKFIYTHLSCPPIGTNPCNRLCQSSVYHCLENRQKKDFFSSEFYFVFNVLDDYVKLVCSYTFCCLLFSVLIFPVLQTNHRLGTCL